MGCNYIHIFINILDVNVPNYELKSNMRKKILQANRLWVFNLLKVNLSIHMIPQLRIVRPSFLFFLFWTYMHWGITSHFNYWSFIAFTKITRVNSTDYELKLVDTAGQDEYSIFPAQYSMDFHGYVLVYSITSQKSFEIVQIIYDKILDVMGKAQWVLIYLLYIPIYY